MQEAHTSTGGQTLTDKPYYLGPWRVEPHRHCLIGPSGEVRVPLKVMQLLCYLAQAGAVVSREDLLNNIWPENQAGDESLTQAVSQLRKLLGDSARQPRYIETVPKKGYRLMVAPALENPSVEERPRPAPRNPRRYLLVWSLLACLVLVMSVVWFRSSQSPVTEMVKPWRVTPLTSTTGRETDPDFSPDGRGIAFSRDGDIQIKNIEGSELVTITEGPALDRSPKWFPDGKSLAFVRYRQGTCGIYAKDLTNGEIQKLTDCNESSFAGMSIHPSAGWLAYSQSEALLGRNRIHLLHLESRKTRTLTHLPPGSPNTGDIYPAFSPDGRRMAFARGRLGTRVLYVLELEEDPAGGLTALGEPRALTAGSFDIQGLTWAADGKSLIYSRSTLGEETLWRVSTTGDSPESQWLPMGNRGAVTPSAALRGGHLAFVEEQVEENIWHAIRRPDGTTTPAEPLIQSTRWDFNPVHGPDGRRIALVSNRSGSMEIWLYTTGRPLKQLTNLGNLYTILPDWSPDGRSLVFCSSNGNEFSIYKLELETGDLEPLVKDGMQNILPRWSRDGASIYFSSNRAGSLEIWKLEPATGKTSRVTHDQGIAARETRDGRGLIYCRLDARGLWIKPTAGGEAKQLMAHLGPADFNNWTVETGGIYFAKRDKEGSTIAFYDFQTGTIANVLKPKRELGTEVNGFSTFRNEQGTHFLFSQTDRLESDIQLVEGFK